MTRLPDPLRLLLLLVVIASCAVADVSGAPATNAPATTPPPAPAPAPAVLPHVRKFRAIDADNHNIFLNRPGTITLLIGTGEDSQEAARQAGKAVYPFRGRSDFQLIVVVDLRDSLATWVPAIVTAKMRSSLDQEAIDLKPYYLKNGNKSNPRTSTYVIPDFTGTVCPQLGWTTTSDSLRGILFGVDGRELERWDKIDDMAKLQSAVHDAIDAQVEIEEAKLAAAAKTPGSKLLHSVYQHPPLVLYTPWPPKSE